MSKVEVIESAQGSERANMVEAISPTGAVKPPCRPVDAKSPLLRNKLVADSTFDIDSQGGTAKLRGICVSRVDLGRKNISLAFEGNVLYSHPYYSFEGCRKSQKSY